MSVSFQYFTVTPLEENCYVVWDDETRDAVVIDPGGEADLILTFLKDRALNVRLILNTHGHIDHIGANAALRTATGAPIGVHPHDAPMLSSRLLCGADWVGLPFEEHSPDFLLAEGEAVGEGALRFEVTHTPGHSPGSVMLHLPEAGLLFSGDLVFAGAVGRWDLPGGDQQTLFQSIREKFLALPDSTRVLPGHGPGTTVGYERRTNPYVAPLDSAGR